jgi:hypothetical protein
MKKRPTRIIEHTRPSGTQYYTVQFKRFGIWFTYDDEWTGSYTTLEDARKAICWCDGTKFTKRIIE